MLRMIWGSSRPPPESLAALSAVERETRLKHAIEGLEMIMNDDIDNAEAVFDAHNDGYHLCGKAIAVFIRAMLGFEKKEIAASAKFIHAAITSLESEMNYTLTDSDSVFSNGSIYKVCIAQLHIQLAVLGFLSESIPEAMKAVWKLKSAYNTLHSLHDETKRLDSSMGGIKGDVGSNPMGLSFTDHFIYCGAISGYGILTLIISLLPPRVAKVLSIIGFKGSKEQALEALWSVTGVENIHGAMSVLGLLIYHGEFLGLCDIVLNEREDLIRCSEVLKPAMKRYPQSALWQLQAAKMEQKLGNLSSSITMLESIKAQGQMKQIEALKMYDLGLSYVFTHEWRKAREQFILITKCNDWSKVFYYYMIGCCYAEQYFSTKEPSDAVDAEKWFTDCLAATATKIAGRVVPLETYVKRKITKWQARSAAHQCDLPIVDGITVSPMLEFMQLFNGWKKLDSALLNQSLMLAQRLGITEDLADDRAVRSLCQAAIHRRLGDGKAISIIGEINTLHNHSFKTISHPETWVIPFIYYETACCLWSTHSNTAIPEIRVWLNKARSYGESEFEQRLAARCTIALQTVNSIH